MRPDAGAGIAAVAARLGVEPARLVPLGEGDFCLAFTLGSRVVRVAKHAEAAEALRREACLLPRIADRLPLPVPRPSFHDPGGCPPFSVHHLVDGEALTREGWEALPPVAREGCAADLAGFLAALHRLPPEQGHHCGLETLRLPSIAAGLRARAAEALHPLLAADVRARLDAILARASDPSGARPEALLHRDVAPGHVLFDPASGRLSGVIDFGDLAIGDPARDFVYVYEDFGTGMLRAVLRHYPLEDPATLEPRVRTWYLLEAVAWTLDLLSGPDDGAVEEAIREIARETAAVPD